MKVTVITVAYNAGATIADACRSVEAQDWPDIEHIIIDGGSRDTTAAAVAASARPGHVFVSEPDDGLYDAMNKGLALATGELIGFLNADDFFCRTDAVRLIAGAALARPGAAAIAGAVAIVAANDINRLSRAYPPTPFHPFMLRLAHMPPHPGFYTRAAAMRQVGGFDPAIKIGADFDWMVRFFAGHRLAAHFIPETLVTLRAGGLSNSGFASRQQINREALATLHRNGLLALPPLVWAKYLVKSLQFVVPPKAWPAPAAVRFPGSDRVRAGAG